MTKGKEFISQLKLYSDYLNWDENLNRYETWEEACDKVLNTHTVRYGSVVTPYLNEIRESYHNKEFLSSQRNLQFRGESIFKHNTKIYNCTTAYGYAPDIFNRGFYVLLSGCIPDAVFNITDAFPDGLTVVVLAASLIPITLATSELADLTISAPANKILSLNSSGLVIQPVIDTPIKD